MGISYVDGAYNRATGTRAAFDALSDELVAEDHPPMVSLSGDRESEDQERIWYERMTLTPGDRHVYGYRWWEGRKWFRIHPDTVAPPRTSNHEARRSNDLKWPYNADTAAARRAEQLAPKHKITREGRNFRELWHWTHWGPLGAISTTAGGNTSQPEPTEPAEPEAPEEDDMTIKNVMHHKINADKRMEVKVSNPFSGFELNFVTGDKDTLQEFADQYETGNSKLVSASVFRVIGEACAAVRPQGSIAVSLGDADN